MGDLVNLRVARKRKSREQAEIQAATRRQAFGRSKSEKSLTGLQREIEERRLEGHRLDPREDGA